VTEIVPSVAKVAPKKAEKEKEVKIVTTSAKGGSASGGK
jgi:hypothetical protein